MLAARRGELVDVGSVDNLLADLHADLGVPPNSKGITSAKRKRTGRPSIRFNGRRLAFGRR